MGIDLKSGGRIKLRKERKLLSKNIYHKLLVKLYKFLARRTTAKFNKTVLKRLLNSRINRSPVSLSKIAKQASQKRFAEMEKNGQEVIFAVVGSVTDDARLLEVPAMRVCALKFTERARERILAAKGKCITFEQLTDHKEKVLSYLEELEIEKQRNISDLPLVFLVHMLNLMLDLREESSNKQEERDDHEDSEYKKNRLKFYLVKQ